MLYTLRYWALSPPSQPCALSHILTIYFFSKRFAARCDLCAFYAKDIRCGKKFVVFFPLDGIKKFSHCSFLCNSFYLFSYAIYIYIYIHKYFLFLLHLFDYILIMPLKRAQRYCQTRWYCHLIWFHDEGKKEKNKQILQTWKKWIISNIKTYNLNIDSFFIYYIISYTI